MLKNKTKQINIEVGGTYKINHRRKGILKGVITSIDDEWISVNVIDGEKEKEKLRISFCYFSEINNDKNN